MATSPFNIIVASPFTVYVAPIGTAFPDIDVDPTTGWVSVGQNGASDYDDSGVTVSHTETIDFHTFLGSTGPRKATRSAEGLTVEFTLHDLSLESYAIAIGSADVTEVAAGAGTAGTKSLPLYKGFDVVEKAILVRGASPYGDWNMQYECPVAAVECSAKVVYDKKNPAGLAIVLHALEDPEAATPSARFGQLIAQSAIATT